MSSINNEFKSNTKSNVEVEDHEMTDIESNENLKNIQDIIDSNDVDYISESEMNGGVNIIKEKIDSKKAKKCLENNDFEKYYTFQITDERDFTPIFDSIANNNLVSEEMKNISKELKELLDKKIINATTLDLLHIRMVRYYKLNVATLALHTYNPKVIGDIENITKILKSFVLKNRITIAEYTRHVIIEKKATDCEFNIIVTAGDLHLFDIFEKVSLNNLEQDLPKAKMIFYDIYMSWVLTVIIAMSVHNAKYDVPVNAKKTIEDILKDKIVALNSDSTNPISKKLINVVKKEKATSAKPKKVKEVISKEGQEAIEKLSKDKKKKKPSVKGQNLKSIDHSLAIEEVSKDLKAINLVDEDVVTEGDLVM